ncbi:hypothetical protein PspLS_10863 [Pyricularia sp. CBS 133598]|nr:hypothetical protein PspLS_10863 [Pyricularia sp. CBS 133598]
MSARVREWHQASNQVYGIALVVPSSTKECTRKRHTAGWLSFLSYRCDGPPSYAKRQGFGSHLSCVAVAEGCVGSGSSLMGSRKRTFWCRTT